MPTESREATLKVTALRGGTIAEITSFLNDLETAYTRLYHFDIRWLRPSLLRRRHLIFELEMGLPFPFLESPREELSPDSILPVHRLVVSKVSINSPGFWEFLASLNPLQQIREYLNDRHKRRQDREYKELSERERLVLENDLIQRQIAEKDNAIVHDRVQLMRELGFTDEEIRQVVWSQIGTPLAKLGRHQDARLIEGAELTSTGSDDDVGRQDRGRRRRPPAE